VYAKTPNKKLTFVPYNYAVFSQILENCSKSKITDSKFTIKYYQDFSQKFADKF